MDGDTVQALFNRLDDALGRIGLPVIAQDVEYRVTDVDPSDLEFTDGDWDGSQARQSMPNPSDEDADLSTLDQGFVFVPQGDEARDSKGNWVCPFRQTPDGPAHVSGLVACLAAINGSRGGIEGVSDSALRDGYDWVVDALVAGGQYDDRDEAPDFQAAGHAMADLIDVMDDGDGDDITASDPTTVELEAEAVGMVDTDHDPSTQVEAAEGDGLMGVIWGSGHHNLSLGGEGTKVYVPPETIPPTFEAAKEDVEAGDVTLGFDHPGDDSVAAQTGIVDIGVADDVALSADEEHIVLTDSTLTNDQAAEAAEAGDFDDLDWSVVADVHIRRDDDGDPVMSEDGGVTLDATRINRIDAVVDGAVDAASIERSEAELPDLKSMRQTVQQAASDPNHANISAAVTALQAGASALSDTDMENFDPDEFEDVTEAVEAASTVIEDQQDQIESLSGAFNSVVAAADVDVDTDDDPEAAAQAVIDAQTADLRKEVAEMEAELAAYDVDDVDQRADDLKGQSASELQALRNERAYQKMQVQEKEQTRGAAAARSDTTGQASATAGNDEDADALAQKVMDGEDRINAQMKDQSPAEYLQAQYDVDPTQYDDVEALRTDVIDAATGGGD